MNLVSPKKCLVAKLGLCDYLEALSLQQRAHRMRCNNKVDDLLLLLEHPHVITIGAGGDKTDLLVPEATLKEKGVTVIEVRRGGRLTYHGPGQLVGYPVICLSDYFKDVHRYLRKLEEVIILTLQDYGIAGDRISGLTGVWVRGEKIASIGVEIRKWVTMHGFALNVNPRLSFFSYITPCGINSISMTSMLANSSSQIKIDMDDICDKVASYFAEVFEIDMSDEISHNELVRLLAAVD